MSAFLKVIEAGLCTTVQDLGRFGYQAQAVPVCGVRDRDAMRLANRLVGNSEETAVLEISLTGPSFEVMADSVRVALAGADGSLEIIAPEKMRVPVNQSVTLCKGSCFHVGPFSGSFSTVLAVTGGFALEPVLRSYSTCLAGSFGGFMGRALKAGDMLPLVKSFVDLVDEPSEKLLLQPFPEPYQGVIRVVPGPQAEYFKQSAIDTFYSSTYKVTAQSDRMGLRLQGERLQHSKGFNLVSDGIVTGAVQVPGNGQPIILFNDHQITGGYPKIATVISTDLSTLGRLGPGDSISFRPVSVSVAEEIRRSHEYYLQKMCSAISNFTSEREALEMRLAACDLFQV